jgi:hypothetical protein
MEEDNKKKVNKRLETTLSKIAPKKKKKSIDFLKIISEQIDIQEQNINNKDHELGVYNGLLIARMLFTGKDEPLKILPPRLR